MRAKNITSHPFGKLASAGLPANISHFCRTLIGMRRPAAVLFPPAVLLFSSTLFSSAGVNGPHSDALCADLSAITRVVRGNMHLLTNLGAVECNP